MSAKEEQSEPEDVLASRDVFLRTLLNRLTGVLQDVVGVEDASGFISLVGQDMGDQINRQRRRELGVNHLDRDQVTELLVALKARIDGDFYVIEEGPDRIILGNRRCPFGDKVLDRPTLCMMTSNVFGNITAQNLGYAKVELQETIAKGDAGCRIVIHLNTTDGSSSVEGREYFQD